MKKYFVILLLSGVLTASGVFAGPLSVSSDDNIQSVLSAHQGKQVTVRLTSGGEITGKVGAVNNEIVHLVELSGREFFDAIAPLQKIEAVIIRTKP